MLISNTSSEAIRLWESWNSWGWYALSIELKSDLDPRVRIIKRQVRDWTINGPTYLTLAPGESHEIKLDVNDGWWEWDGDLSELRDEPLSVRVRYEVGPTPESEKLGVFVGTVLSDWVASMPPHTWLFGGSNPVSVRSK